MLIEQIYTGCLAQGAYYIESNGEAVIIDPLRETRPYLEKADQRGAKIKYVLETHFHADFVSGHVDLARASGAQIVFGPNAQTTYAAYIAKDGEELRVGEVTIKMLHTPGHTMESTTYLLKDEKGKDYAVFTGDTLFIGDVGRPDLAAKSELTQEQLAGHLYDSLRNKIMPLDEDVLVYPAHGAGSACGKNMSKETFDTLGHQKQTNYALRADMTKGEFVKEVTDGLLPPPSYFPLNVKMNREGYDNIEEVLEKGLQALTPEAFEATANETGALVLDTRKPEEFANGFIPNSVNIGIDGSFAPWVGTLIPDIRQQILLVTDEEREEEVVTRLARVGYDYTIGYLKGGFAAWEEAGKDVDAVNSIKADEFARLYEQDKGIKVVDVRKPGEYESEHVETASNAPLDYLNEHMAELPKEEAVYLHCAGGYRSMIAASILKARGFDNVVNVEGGFKAIAETSVPRTAYVCPSTLK
ncbi:glyoxylase-like metal-dependent hydrolase (beta-lactamase superfamily II) [Pontibacter ummariensis]|uniref:Glyoxylase, beta-lactamase superfamily II n=1 Tax=Pontibacter ummariensis TaxID=1610492 RepID=A0A239KRG5_9BACT|nr:MBL fold metallo-hydrolase [Pontibacter ummariensis]PRY04992.1 glyoxylase-like metal-dependent hydrolase (beta-lactamase superfamily II) [Pontibacter ummariensis]SNT20781.1 Glyoxylase, beta-lactamase superfamily II [Pontibacter ummariensis]